MAAVEVDVEAAEVWMTSCAGGPVNGSDFMRFLGALVGLKGRGPMDCTRLISV